MVETAGLTFHIVLGGQVYSGDGVRLTAEGVGVTLTKLTGWWETPATTGSVTQRSGRHGTYINKAFYTERNIVLEGEIFAPNRVALINGLETLFASIPIDELAPLQVHEQGMNVRHIMVRQAGGAPIADWEGKVDASGDGLTSKFSIQLVAPDPRRLSGNGLTGFTKVINSSAGLPGVGGTLINEGKGLVPPTKATVFGGCQDPWFQINGVRVYFSGLYVSAGEQLVIDFEKRTAKVGTLNVLNKADRRLPYLNDRENEILYGGALNGNTFMRLESYDSYR